MSFTNFNLEDNREAMNLDARAAAQIKFTVGEIVYFQTGTQGDEIFPVKIHTNKKQGFKIISIGKEETHLTAIGEPTKPPRNYRIDNFRLIKINRS